jgi:hypothetical protein
VLEEKGDALATILRNDDAEALILDIRAGCAAATQVLDDRPGAFLVFPTSVVVPCPRGGQAVYPLRTDAEPGMLVRDCGQTSVSAVVEGVGVTGVFCWKPTGAGGPTSAVDSACYRFERKGRSVVTPAWADQLPRSRCLMTQTGPMLAREQVRLVRRGRVAEHWLLTLTERIMRQKCRGPIRLAIDHRPQVDVDDVVQRGLQTACRLLPIYASAKRPPCSWLGMIQLDSKRDMHREVSRLDWLPGGGQGSGSQPTIAPTAVAGGASTLTSLDSLHPSYLEARVGRIPPEIEAIDNQEGTAAAAVARLVDGDPEIIALAAGGDAVALRRVSKLVVGALGTDGETQAGTRRRCWAEFSHTGHLFATDAGMSRFASLAPPGVLSAIDASLVAAAGVCGPDGGRW